MGFIADFKKFALKGNVIDLAVGVVIGGAFTTIVNQLVNGIIMPFVSLFFPQGNWMSARFRIRADAVDPAKDIYLAYGQVLAAVLNFLIVALVLFLIVSKIIKGLEDRFTKKPEPPKETKDCPFCLSEIPIKATRCKACTSQLGEGAAA
jgi:large conductance mechanosensitive channel